MKKEKIVYWFIAFFGIVITNWLAYNTGWTHCNDEKKRPFVIIHYDKTKWEDQVKREKGTVEALSFHNDQLVIAKQIVKNEEFKKYFYLYNDSIRKAVIDSLKEVEEAIIYYKSAKILNKVDRTYLHDNYYTHRPTYREAEYKLKHYIR